MTFLAGRTFRKRAVKADPIMENAIGRRGSEIVVDLMPIAAAQKEPLSAERTDGSVFREIPRTTRRSEMNRRRDSMTAPGEQLLNTPAAITACPRGIPREI